MCKSFVKELWDDNGTKFDDCGIMLQNPCDGGKQYGWNQTKGGWEKITDEDGEEVPVLDDWDPYMCGDNLIIPRSALCVA